MLSLTFTSARQTTLSRAGMDVLYFYRKSDSAEVHRFHVSGSDLSWTMSEQEKYEYAQLLFTDTVSYLKKYWEAYRQLPDENTVIHDKLDFVSLSTEKTAWEGYVLELL